MSALVLASVVEDVAVELAAEREYLAKLKTCRCGTEYIVYNDHKGPTFLCRKCANRFMEKQAWEDQHQLYEGDLVLLCDSTPLSFQWQEAFNPVLLDEMKLEPVYSKMGVVKRILDDTTVEVQSLRCPNVVATKIYFPRSGDNLLEKIGHLTYVHKGGAVPHLYPHAAFVYTELMRSGRTGFQVKLPPEPRGQN